MDDKYWMIGSRYYDVHNEGLHKSVTCASFRKHARLDICIINSTPIIVPIILFHILCLPFFVVGIVTFHIVDCRDTIEPANDKYHIVQDGDAKVAAMYVHARTRSPLQTSRRPALHGVESSKAIESTDSIDGIAEGHAPDSTPTAA